jgi:hypothetical protein
MNLLSVLAGALMVKGRMAWTCRDGIAMKLLYIGDAKSPASRNKPRSSDMAFDDGIRYAEPTARYPAIFQFPLHPLL